MKKKTDYRGQEELTEEKKMRRGREVEAYQVINVKSEENDQLEQSRE